MGRVSVVCNFLFIDDLRTFIDSEQDVPMDMDEGSPENKDDLCQYNLDDYDEDEQTAGEHPTTLASTPTQIAFVSKNLGDLSATLKV